jgi:hypothetical protein
MHGQHAFLEAESGWTHRPETTIDVVGHERRVSPQCDGERSMKLQLGWAILLALGACSPRPEPSQVAPASTVERRAEAPPTRPSSLKVTPEACLRDGYSAFFEAFVRNPELRTSLAFPGAPAAEIDIAMRDDSWVLASSPDTLVDVQERRAGDDLFVSVKPVERNGDDEVVRALGPTRTYTFRHEGGCWRFAGVK